MWDGSETLDQFARRRIAEGERDDVAIAREFLEPLGGEEVAKDHLEATFPAVREYIRNRVRYLIKDLEREFVREAEKTSAGESIVDTEATCQTAPPRDKQTTRMQDFLADKIYVPGYGMMVRADCGEGHFTLAIEGLEQQKLGIDKSIAVLRWCVRKVRESGVQRFGDVLDLPDEPPEQ